MLMPLVRRVVLLLATAASCSNEPLAADTSDSSSSNSGVGHTCDLLADAGPKQAVYNSQALECKSRICLKPIQQDGVTGVDTGALCSAECSQDSDCVGQTRDPGSAGDRRCVGGFACVVAFVVGPLCCKKLCLCKDFLAGPQITPVQCDPSKNNGQIACAQ
jgi:hypothetical protein